jgi:sulfonate dioxygenase
VHKAIPGGYDVTLREGKRTAIFGERPYFDPKSESLSERKERLKKEKESDGKVNGVVEKVKEVALNN